MILELIQQSLGETEINQIGRQLSASPAQAQQAVLAALPLLLGAMGRNSADPQGAAALAGALERDHDGSILENLSGFLGQANTGLGDSILRHVLGSRRKRVETGLGQAPGLEGIDVSRLLSLLAPIVMGALGKARTDQQLDPAGLPGFLRSETSQVAAQSRMGGLLSLLDADGDGQVVDDIARIGSQLLEGFFNKKK